MLSSRSFVVQHFVVVYVFINTYYNIKYEMDSPVDIPDIYVQAIVLWGTGQLYICSDQRHKNGLQTWCFQKTWKFHTKYMSWSGLLSVLFLVLLRFTLPTQHLLYFLYVLACVLVWRAPLLLISPFKVYLSKCFSPLSFQKQNEGQWINVQTAYWTIY